MKKQKRVVIAPWNFELPSKAYIFDTKGSLYTRCSPQIIAIYQREFLFFFLIFIYFLLLRVSVTVASSYLYLPPLFLQLRFLGQDDV